MVSNLSNEDIQNDQEYFSTYKSPNICIVPSASICYPSSPKRPKLEISNTPNSPQNIDLSFLDDFDVDEIIKCLNDSDENEQNMMQSDNENNDILEKECIKSSLKIANYNERNAMKYSNIERGLLTKSMDNEEIHIVVENTHVNSNIEKHKKSSSTDCNENKHYKDDYNILKFSPLIEQPNNTTYNIAISDYTQNNITSNEIESYHQNNEAENNTQKVVKDKTVDNLLQREQDLSSPNKGFTIEQKPPDGNRNAIGNINNMKNVDKMKCSEKKYLQYSNDSEFQDKEITTTILKTERAIDKLNTNGITESKHLHTNYGSQNVNNNKSKVKVQKEIDKKRAGLPENNIPKTDTLINNNLENQTLKILHKKYSKFIFMYSGKYSKIFKCIDSEGEQYAVKMLKKKYNGHRQNGLLNKIRGDIPKDNLLCVYLVAGFSFNNSWCYLTDYYPNNLKDVLKETKRNLHIDTIQELAGQLLGAITTLRNKNIVHSDINPSHILLDHTNRKLRVCGFDRAYYIESANLFPYKGTKCYRAPEVILGYSGGFSLDVWSTALVLHEMATGIQLFGGCIDDHVLYKQMCLLGDVPPDMLLRSQYGHKYIIGYCFQDKCLRHKSYPPVKVKSKIACTIHGAYYSHWAAGKNQKQISKDMQKIGQFIKLLDKMLVISPEHRLPIEFAYTNPFIYNVFNS